MPDMPMRRRVPGHAIVARRALVEIARDAVLGSYGVTGVAEPTLLWRVRSRLGLGSGAIRVELRPDVRVQAWIRVAYGLPVAEVARQVDSAVRYCLCRALGHEIGSIALHVEGLGRPYTSAPAAPAAPAAAVEPAAPAASGAVAPAPGETGAPTASAHNTRTGGGAS